MGHSKDRTAPKRAGGPGLRLSACGGELGVGCRTHLKALLLPQGPLLLHGTGRWGNNNCRPQGEHSSCSKESGLFYVLTSIQLVFRSIDALQAFPLRA